MPDIDGLTELPPEANPLTPQNLYATLVNASSHNQIQIRTATQQLSNWEKEPGYFSSLQTILLDKSIPQVDVRYLAVIQLKNGIDKYWRKHAQNALSKDEKTLIRSRCLDYGINEADHRLALQNALLVAKVVRYDFPQDWPGPITSIAQALRTAAQEDAGSPHLPRTILILLHVIKELSTARLSRSRRNLYDASPEIFQVLATIYVQKINNWLGFMRQGGSDEAKAINDVELSLLALRTLRRVLIGGYEHPGRHDEVHSFWNVIRLHFSELLSLLQQHGQQISAQIRWIVEKHLLQMSKIHLAMVREHTPSFAQLPEAVGIAKAYWDLLSDFGQSYGAKSPIAIEANSTEDEEPSFMEKLALKALLLLRSCTRMAYNPARVLHFQQQQERDERKTSTQAIKDQLLSPSLVEQLAIMLVNQFFTYTTKDLRQWEDDPAEWEHQEAGVGESWELSIRLCAEKLFEDLLTHNKDLLTPVILERFHYASTSQHLPILTKDSIYSAIALGASVLEEKVDFDGFMRSMLVADLQSREPGSKLLRRRIAIMLGQWIVVKDIERSSVYQIFHHLLDKSSPLNDYVVRVTAGRQMDPVVNNYDVQVDKLAPYAGEILDRLLGLVQEVELAESKLALLAVINSIVERLELKVNPYAQHIFALLPPLWEQAGDGYFVKQTILGILTTLLNAMKAESACFFGLIAPLVESSIQPGSETREYLLEDALELWSCMVSQSTAPAPPEIAVLAQFLLPLFELGSDMLKKALEITEQYILLAPELMIKAAPQIATPLANLLSANIRREASSQIIRVAEVLVQVATEMEGAAGAQVVTNILVQSRLLAGVVSGVKSAHDAHQTTGPNRVRTEIEGLLESDYFSLLARILWASPSLFVESISAATSLPFESSIDWLLNEWLAHLQEVGNSDRKKLMCMALTKLLELGPEKRLLERLQQYINAWTETLCECMDYEDDRYPAGRDCMVYDDLEKLRLEGRTEAPEEERRRKLLFYDPCHRVDIKEFVRLRFQKLVEMCGGEEAFQRDWLVNVDSDVVKGFAKAAGI